MNLLLAVMVAMATTINIPLDKFVNPRFQFAFMEPCRSIPVQIFYGGAASGKSVSIAQRDVLDCVSECRNFLIVRAVANTIRGSVFEERIKAINQFHLRSLFDIRGNSMEIVYAPRGNRMIFKGLDDVEKLKSITVPVGTLTDLRVEEATEVTEAAYDQLSLRIARGLCDFPKREVLSFNPVMRTHWIAKKWFNGQLIYYHRDKDKMILHSTHLDNHFLSEGDHAKIESMKGYMYDVYAKGKWGVLGDTIFTNWEVRDLAGLEFDSIRNGLDFGFTSGVSALCRCAVRASEKTIYITKETYDRGMTNLQLADRLKPIVGSELLWCDSAEPKSIQELRMYGINAQPVKKGKDSVYHSIQWLQQWHIIIDKTCMNAQNEFSQFQWMKNKEGEIIQQPTGDDHFIDALRYATERDRSYDVPIISVG